MNTNPYPGVSPVSKRAIQAAIQSQGYIIGYDNKNHPYIDLFADINEPNDFLLQTAYDHRHDSGQSGSGAHFSKPLIQTLQDQILRVFKGYITDTENDILIGAGFDPYAPDSQKIIPLREYLRSAYPIYPPYEEFLEQPIPVNIVLATPEERAYHYGLIHSQYVAMARPYELSDSSPEAVHSLITTDSCLKRLVEQQGFTMADLDATVKEYQTDFLGPGGFPAPYLNNRGKLLPADQRYDRFSADHGPFLSSLCRELSNQHYTRGCLTLLATMSMTDFARMMESDAETTMPVDTRIGIFSPWNGTGSVLGISLARELTFHRKTIMDVQIEGAKADYDHTIDSAYGPCHRLRRSPQSIRCNGAACKPPLESTISSASLRANRSTNPVQGRNGPDMEI